MKSRRLLIEISLVLSTIFILLWIFIPKFLIVQTINMPKYIPDPAIRRAASIALLNEIDGPFTKKQAAELTGKLKFARCTNLKGLEYFPNLTELEIQSYYLKEMDFSMLPNLEILHITGGDIITLITKNNPELKEIKVHIQESRMVSLPIQVDFTNNPKLERIYVEDCQTLDITHCPNVITLSCISSSGYYKIDNKIGLSTLDLRNNPLIEKLTLPSNYLRTLDLSHNHQLTELQCNDNEIEELDLRHNPLLEYVAASQPTLKTIYLPDSPKVKEIWAEFKLLDERTQNELKEKGVDEYRSPHGFGVVN